MGNEQHYKKGFWGMTKSTPKTTTSRKDAAKTTAKYEVALAAA